MGGSVGLELEGWQGEVVDRDGMDGRDARGGFNFEG